jgi:hypothetical protein
LPVLATVEGRGLAYCQLEFIDEIGKTIPGTVQCHKTGRERTLNVQQFLKNQSLLKHVYCQSVILKTGRLPSPIKFRPDWRQAADVIFFSEWASHCGVIMEVQAALCQYRVHASSSTGNNRKQIDAWVLEEWRAMMFIDGMLTMSSFDKWLHLQKQKSLFAARSKVKIQSFQNSDSRYVSEVRDATLAKVGRLHWILGNLAVGLRSFFQYFQPKLN